MMAEPKRASEWTIHGERVVDDTRRAVLSIADVELPDGVRFEQYVLRVPAAAMVIVLDDDERVLMMWRHRFIVDGWVWELPGGYLDQAEDSLTCAAREVEEETGWRPRSIEKLISFFRVSQPADSVSCRSEIPYLAGLGLRVRGHRDAARDDAPGPSVPEVECCRSPCHVRRAVLRSP